MFIFCRALVKGQKAASPQFGGNHCPLKNNGDRRGSGPDALHQKHRLQSDGGASVRAVFTGDAALLTLAVAELAGFECFDSTVLTTSTQPGR